MKTIFTFLSVILIAAFLTGCTSLVDLAQKAVDENSIKPSDVIITEVRDVTGFDAIEMRTFGKVNITQGDKDSLTIEGSDNIVPLVKTTVKSGLLVIELSENVSLLNVNRDNILTFNITLRDLTALTVSGVGDVRMPSLNTTGFNLVMSGAGSVNVQDFSAENLNVTVSGAGGVEISGSVDQAIIEIPGAGNVNAGDLKSQSATVNISGIGSTTVWAVDQLSGTISGAGDVSYYGDPQTSTTKTGVGSYKALGEK